MGGKNDAPDPPDYRAAAEEQAEASREITLNQTYANRPYQVTPWGDITWSTERVIDPASNTPVTAWTQRMSLDPDLQAGLDDQQAITRGRSDLALGLLDRSRDEFGPMVDWDQFTDLRGAPDMPEYSADGFQDMSPQQMQTGLDFSNAYEVGDPTQIRNRAEDAIYDRRTSRLDPEWDQRMSDMDIQLRNQGLTPGDEAYDRAIGNLERARTDAYEAAGNEAIIGGGAESDRMFNQMMGRRGQDISEITGAATFGNQARESQFGQNARTREQQLTEMLRMGAAGVNDQIQAANFNNTVRQQQIAEEQQRRGFSLNEINAILTGQQVAQPNMPSFNTASKSETPQYLNAAQMQFDADLDTFNANQAQSQALMQGLGSAAGMFAMSDARLKECVIPHFKVGGLTVYSWSWNTLAEQIGAAAGATVGVMAQEVQQRFPDCVKMMDNGYLAVNYSRLAERLQHG